MAGVQAAKAGGFLCVGINRNKDPQHFANADLIVKDLAEINYSKLMGLFDYEK